MSRRRAPQSTRREHPTTYAAIVKAAEWDHAYRVAELKLAAKMIIAIEADLAALVEIGVYYSVDRYSMYLVDCSGTETPRRKMALCIRNSIANPDRMVSAFLARSWIVDEANVDGQFSKVTLRRPKTQIRVRLDCSAEFAAQLRGQPSEEAA